VTKLLTIIAVVHQCGEETTALSQRKVSGLFGTKLLQFWQQIWPFFERE